MSPRAMTIPPLLTCVLLLGLGPQAAQAEHWTQLQPAQGKQAALYIDSDSIATQPNGWRQFWLKSVPSATAKAEKRRKEAQKPLGEVRLRHALECQSRAIIPPLEIVPYRANGKPLQRIRQDADKLMTTRRDVLTMPAGDKVLEAVCGAVPAAQSAQQNAPSQP